MAINAMYWATFPNI